MKLTDAERAEVLEALEDISSTYGAPNSIEIRGVIFRAELVPDCESFEDVGAHGDTYGRTQWGTLDRHALDYYGIRTTRRPAGMDGNAERLSIGRGNDSIWWQPPSDIPRTDREAFSKLRQLVSEILEYGFSFASVERCEGRDAYGRPIVRAVATLGGIEPSADSEYLREIVAELLTEVTDQGEG